MNIDEKRETIEEAVEGENLTTQTADIPVEHGDCEKRLKDAEEKMRRYLADYQNLQRRTQEQRIEWIRSANKDLLLKLLPVLDTLLLTAQHVKDKGLELAISEFLKVLEKEGVEKIKTLGVEFDPRTMECVQIVVGDESNDGLVTEELRSGFMLNDVVLRTAQVNVAQNTPKVSNQPSDTKDKN